MSGFLELRILDYLTVNLKSVIIIVLPILLTILNVCYLLKKYVFNKAPLIVIISVAMGFSLILLSILDVISTLLNISPILVWTIYCVITGLLFLIILKYILTGNFQLTIYPGKMSLTVICVVALYLGLAYYMFLNSKYGVGVFWDDIYRYPLISNDYRYIGPTLRTPYVAWPSLIGFLSNVSILPYYHVFSILLFFSAIIPLSIYCYYLGLITACKRNSFALLFTTLIVLLGANLCIIPILLNYNFAHLLSDVHLSYLATVEKYGPPNFVGALLYPKAAAIGLAMGLLAISMPFFKDSEAKNSKRELLLKLISLIFFIYQLYMGNLLFAVITAPLLLWRFRNTLPQLTLFALFVALALDFMFRFPFVNFLIIRLSNFAAQMEKYCLLTALIGCPAVSCLYLFRPSVSKKKIKIIPNMHGQGIFTLLCVMLCCWVFYSLLVETLNFNVYKYSDIWLKHVILPPTYFTIKTFGWTLPFLSILILIKKYIRRELLMETILWSAGFLIQNTLLIMLSGVTPVDVENIIFINRSISYAIIPMGIFLSLAIEILYTNARRLKRIIVSSILAILFLTSLIYTVLYTFTWVELGSKSTLPLEKMKILEYFSQLRHDDVITIVVHDEGSIIYYLSSLPNVRIIWLERDYPFTGPSEYYRYLINASEKEIAYVFSSLLIDYIVVNEKSFKNSELSSNSKYIRYLHSLSKIHIDRYTIYINEPKIKVNACYPYLVPSPLNFAYKQLGIKDCLSKTYSK